MSAGFQFAVVAPGLTAGPAGVGFFTEALAQYAASAMYNIGMPLGVSGGSRRSLIRAIEVLATQNFGPEFNFFSSANGFTTNVDTDAFIARWGFLAANGKQLGGSGLWRYYVDGLAIPYVDDDTVMSTTPATLHVVLTNLEATAKSASAAGGPMSVTFWLEAESGF